MDKLKICPRHLECREGSSDEVNNHYAHCYHMRPHKCINKSRLRGNTAKEGVMVRHQVLCTGYGDVYARPAGPCITYKGD